jgi:ubiquinone biosynthesis protein COQ9
MTEARLIDAVVARAALDGWNDATLRAALRDIGEDPMLLASYFPRGAAGAVADWIALTDQRMEAAAAEEDLLALRVPARIRRLIELRLRLIEPNFEALRAAMPVLALPWNIGLGLRATARTASAIWHAAGDSSADFSWYTRRLTLAAVYSATLAYWLSPSLPDLDEVLAFLDRRLADIAPRRRTSA